jgi:NAD-reducing hydrogenase small subunit
VAKKLKVATTSLAGCFGCHMSFLDIDERILKLLELVEFDRSPITDIKHCGPCDLGLIEGGLCNAENVHVLREFRKNCKILVAWAPAPSTAACRRSATTSTCATSSKRCTRPKPAWSNGIIPNDPELPLPLNKVHPIHEVVKVDYFLPGCPPPADAIWKLLTDLLAGRTPHAGPRPDALRLRIRHDIRTRNRRPPREAAPRRHRTRVAGRGPRQGHHPARRRQQGAPGAPAHRRIPRLSKSSSRAGPTGKCR